MSKHIKVLGGWQTPILWRQTFLSTQNPMYLLIWLFTSTLHNKVQIYYVLMCILCIGICIDICVYYAFMYLLCLLSVKYSILRNLVSCSS